jgi:segregation and condensation protein B
MEGIIEGLLFAWGEPLSLGKISEIINMDKKTTRHIIDNMIRYYNDSKRGIMIREIENSYQLCTRKEHAEFINKLFEQGKRKELSQAAYEVLAIISYNGPVTRAKIESIRGVNSDSSISKLIERNLIKESGKLDAPGKPSLYEVTEDFLRYFGLKSVNDIPKIEMNELKEYKEEVEANENSYDKSDIPTDKNNMHIIES